MQQVQGVAVSQCLFSISQTLGSIPSAVHTPNPQTIQLRYQSTVFYRTHTCSDQNVQLPLGNHFQFLVKFGIIQIVLQFDKAYFLTEVMVCNGSKLKFFNS